MGGECEQCVCACETSHASNPRKSYTSQNVTRVYVTVTVVCECVCMRIVRGWHLEDPASLAARCVVACTTRAQLKRAHTTTRTHTHRHTERPQQHALTGRIVAYRAVSAQGKQQTRTQYARRVVSSQSYARGCGKASCFSVQRVRVCVWTFVTQQCAFPTTHARTQSNQCVDACVFDNKTCAVCPCAISIRRNVHT